MRLSQSLPEWIPPPRACTFSAYLRISAHDFLQRLAGMDVETILLGDLCHLADTETQTDTVTAI